MTTYDQRHQKVNNQYNAARDININVQPQPDASALFSQGIRLLHAKSYQQAVNTLKEVIKIDPSIRNAYYYLAIALLKGRRPKLLNRNEIQEIDESLTTAIALDNADGLFHWFRALVRDDYYNSNRMTCPSPSVEEIITVALSGTTNIDELKTVLQELPMSNNALYRELVKQVA